MPPNEKPLSLENEPSTVAFKRPTVPHEYQARKTVVGQDDRVLGQYIPLLYHYNMLQDADRVNAFRDAMNLLVRPGMHVVELGAGTGILSSFAARAGASVCSVERNGELVQVAHELIQRNRLQHLVEVIHEDAMTYVPTERVDLVVCEMLHVGLLREKQAQVIEAFKENYRRAIGDPLPIFVPEVSMLMMQPVQQDFEFAGYEAPIPLFQAPIASQPRTIELAPLVPYANIGYSDPILARYDTTLRFQARASGTLNAVRFATQNVLAVDMSAHRAIAWPNQCLVLPISEPLKIDVGHQVDISICYSAGDTVEQLWRSLEVHAAKD